MSDAPKLEVRNVKFNLDSVPRFWHGGRKSVTTFLNNLSVFFPAGERFFIQSVRAHAKKIKDPGIAEEARAFYAQEGLHTREHIRYNEMLKRHGYPVDDLEERVQWILDMVTRWLPKRWHLAATCALEHFTALMAHFLLADPRLLEGADPNMAALWRWHAAEENEHKGVAFDVYREAGGNYFERCFIMIMATVIFWALVVEYQFRLMRVDGIALSLREWSALGRFLFFEPGGMFGLAREYFSYYRPGFHPWDLDNRNLLDAWKVDYQTAPEYRQA